MDALKEIKSLPDFLYEVVIWIVFIPKTFVKIITSPSSFIDHIKAELTKNSEEKFQEYLHPVIFWSVLVAFQGLLLGLFLSKYLSYTESSLDVISNSIGGKLIFSAILLVLIPMIFAVTTQIIARKKLSRDGLREDFYLQIYFFAPLQFFFILMVFSMFTTMRSSTNESEGLTSFEIISFIAGVYSFLFPYHEIILLKKQLNIHWVGALVWFLVISIISLLAIFCLTYLFGDLLEINQEYMPSLEDYK